MTIHQAKGMQWPVVFVPALLRNRFPAAGIGGRNVWHLLPRAGVRGQARFEGTVEDERRLFYVAMTRSQKYLHLDLGADRRQEQSIRLAIGVLDQRSGIEARQAPRRRTTRPASGCHRAPGPGSRTSCFSFSDLKYFFECPYQFKLRILYGFNAPLHEALGYGKSLHDALAEVHCRALRGDVVDASEVPRLVETHLHAPYAYPALRQQLEASAERVLRDYLADNAAHFDKIEFSEKQIEVSLGDGVNIVGRVDLVRRIDTGETTIVDLKSSDRAQAEDVTEAQLHVYALGYQDLTGRRPDYVEIYELDERKRKPRSVDDDFISDVKTKVRDAAAALRTGYPADAADAQEVRQLRLPRHVHSRPGRCRNQVTRRTNEMAKTPKTTPSRVKAEKKVTRYTYDEVKEPRTPETGHTSLLPGEDLVVNLPMDNGWSKAMEVGTLPNGDQRPVVVDMDPAADPVLFWAGKRNRRDVAVLPLQRNEIVSESRIAQIIERARRAADEKSGGTRQGHLFADLEKTLRDSDRAKRVGFYTHEEGWKNKLICGDSLHVMESLIHYENLRGKVQMIFVDPPYGVSTTRIFNSGWIRRRTRTKIRPMTCSRSRRFGTRGLLGFTHICRIWLRASTCVESSWPPRVRSLFRSVTQTCTLSVR